MSESLGRGRIAKGLYEWVSALDLQTDGGGTAFGGLNALACFLPHTQSRATSTHSGTDVASSRKF